jgi:hypothetical protein
VTKLCFEAAYPSVVEDQALFRGWIPNQEGMELRIAGGSECAIQALESANIRMGKGSGRGRRSFEFSLILEGHLSR